MGGILGSTFVGLTDNPIRRRAELGNPPDWRVVRWFGQESDARAWEQAEVMRPSHSAAPEGTGWRFGYKFTLVCGGDETAPDIPDHLCVSTPWRAPARGAVEWQTLAPRDWREILAC